MISNKSRVKFSTSLSVTYIIAAISFISKHGVESSCHQWVTYTCDLDTNTTSTTNNTLTHTTMYTPATHVPHDCATKCAETPECAAFAVRTTDSSDKECAVVSSSQPIPCPTDCRDDAEVIEVWIHADHGDDEGSEVETPHSPCQKTTPMSCHATLIIDNTAHCLVNTRHMTKDHTEALTMCQNLGGRLPEARTTGDLDIIQSVRLDLPGTFSPWMDAMTHVDNGPYYWSNGLAVDDDFWHCCDDPDDPHELCSVLTRARMWDTECEDNPLFRNVVCAIW